MEAEFAKEIHLLTAEQRLKSIARDFVNHYSDLWTSGRAMFVCLNKVTCVRMYNYVQEYWKKEIKKLKAKIRTATQQEAQELERKLKWMEETEMAVVISQEQNEIQTSMVREEPRRFDISAIDFDFLNYSQLSCYISNILKVTFILKKEQWEK